MRLKSAFKITFDPSGTPLVLADYGDTLTTQPFPDRVDNGDDLDFAEAANSLPVGRGGAKRQMTLGVRRTYSSFAAMAAAHQAADSAIPSSAAALTVAVTDDGTTAAATYTYAVCHIRSFSFVPLDKQPLTALLTYTLHLTAPTT